MPSKQPVTVVKHMETAADLVPLKQWPLAQNQANTVAYLPLEKPVLSDSLLQQDVDMIYYKLVVFFHICQAHSIPASLFAGSLLGAARHRGLIPWDDDADAAIPMESLGKLESLKHLFPPCLSLDRYPYGDKGIYFLKVRHVLDYASNHVSELDIFPLVNGPDGTKVTQIPELLAMRFPSNWTSNLTTLPFGPYSFPCLRDWDAYLKRSYGPDCMKRAVKYNHTTRSYGKDTVAISGNAPCLLPSVVLSVQGRPKQTDSMVNKDFWDRVYAQNIITGDPSTFAMWLVKTCGERRDLVKLTKATKLVDLGCGNGRDSRFLSRVCCVTGIDQSTESRVESDSLAFVRKPV
jgi:hypothetical protein